jgi:hypothetical protein
MPNDICYELDVLASSPTEINQIAARLKEIGCEEVRNLGFVDPALNKARRFDSHSYGYPRLDPLLSISEVFPVAIFLLDYCDQMWSYSGKCVIRGGEVIQHVHDGEQQAQSVDWVLLDIFAPFRSEYHAELKFGSLWADWVGGVLTAAMDLKERPPVAGFDAWKFHEAIKAQELARREVAKQLAKLGDPPEEDLPF